MKNRDMQEKWPRKEMNHGKIGSRGYYLRKMIPGHLKWRCSQTGRQKSQTERDSRGLGIERSVRILFWM